MATIDVVAQGNGKKAGTIELDASVFEAPIKPHLFHAEVTRQLAARRRGTHGTKNRSAVSGGGAKPWRQKGTGRARQGTNRAPQWKGGGVVFGPVPRSYAHALPKKVRRAALCGALSARLGEGRVKVVDAIDLEEFKTKRVLDLLGAVGVEGGSVLIVTDAGQPILEKSAKNLKGVTVLPAAGVNVYDVLRHEHLLLTKAGATAVVDRLAARASQ